jgi:hypothetical protein
MRRERKQIGNSGHYLKQYTFYNTIDTGVSWHNRCHPFRQEPFVLISPQS